MPKRSTATKGNLAAFVSHDKLLISKEDILKRMDAGEMLVYEESGFKDPGKDWTALYLNGERVGYWEGY